MDLNEIERENLINAIAEIPIDFKGGCFLNFIF